MTGDLTTDAVGICVANEPESYEMTDLSPVEGGVAAVLMAAADLLDKPGAWTQESYALDDEFEPVMPTSAEASCFCVLGAIRKVSGVESDITAPVFALQKSLRQNIVSDWNDAEGRTQDEVVQALRTAAQATATSPDSLGNGK